MRKGLALFPLERKILLPIALFENAALAGALLVIYEVGEPLLASRSFLSLEAGEKLTHGRLVLVAKKTTVLTYKNAAEAAIAVCFLYELLAVLVQPTLYYSGGVFNDVFLSRVNTGQTTLNGAHVLSDLCIFSLFFLSWSFIHARKGRMDGFQAALYSGLLVFVHESLWYCFYALKDYAYIFLDPFDVVNGDAAIFLVTSTVAFLYFRKYGRPSRLLLAGIGVYFAYLCAWFAAGFPITTVNNHLLGVTLYNQTIWYYVPWVNVVEVCSWLLLFGFFALNASRRSNF